MDRSDVPTSDNSIGKISQRRLGKKSPKDSLSKRFLVTMGSLSGITAIHLIAETLFVGLLAYTLPWAASLSLSQYFLLLMLSFTPVFLVFSGLLFGGLYLFFKESWFGGVFFPWAYALNKTLDVFLPGFFQQSKNAYDYIKGKNAWFLLVCANIDQLYHQLTSLFPDIYVFQALEFILKSGFHNIKVYMQKVNILLDVLFSVAYAICNPDNGDDIQQSPFVMFCRDGFEWLSVSFKCLLVCLFYPGGGVLLQATLYGAIYYGKQYAMDEMLDWVAKSVQPEGHFENFHSRLLEDLAGDFKNVTKPLASDPDRQRTDKKAERCSVS